jgi:hypothetical protein
MKYIHVEIVKRMDMVHKFKCQNSVFNSRTNVKTYVEICRFDIHLNFEL